MTLTSSQARELIEQYTLGWLSGDESMICAPLSNSCIVIESHGDTYSGIEEIQKWISTWISEGRVSKWDIKSFYYDNNTAFFEWDFNCIHKSVSYPIYGSSVVRFHNDKISSIC